MSREDANRIARAAERARRYSRLPLKALVPTAAALGAGAAVAIGQIPGSGGTITACYQNVPAGVNGADNQYGALRVIDPSQTTATDTHVYSCDPSTEQTITWNQTGPTGPQGQTGSQGQAGPQGPPSKIVPESTLSIKSPQYEIFLKLAGVPGDDKKLGDPERVTEFDLGAAGEISGNTKVTVQSFDIRKLDENKAGFTFANYVADGAKIPDGQITVESKSAGKAAVVGVWDFKGIHVTSDEFNGSGQPEESVSFSFAEVKASLGEGQQKLTTGWTTAKSVGFDLTQQKVQ
jgi:type VI protein secretion system component Hcp